MYLLQLITTKDIKYFCNLWSNNNDKCVDKGAGYIYYYNKSKKAIWPHAHESVARGFAEQDMIIK